MLLSETMIFLIAMQEIKFHFSLCYIKPTRHVLIREIKSSRKWRTLMIPEKNTITALNVMDLTNWMPADCVMSLLELSSCLIFPPR